MAQVDAIWLFSVLTVFACLSVTFHHPTLHFYISACGIDIVSDILSKRWAVQLAMHLTVGA